MKIKLKSGLLFIEKIGFVPTFLYFIQRIILRKDSLIKMRIPSVKNTIYLRNKSYDTHIFNQIFIKEEMVFIKLKNHCINTIIDAGANIGLFTIYIKNKFPDSSILSIEPSIKNFEILKKNIEGYENISIIHGALMGTDKMVSISNPLENYASFQVAENFNSNCINAYSLLYFLQLPGFEKIDLVKMDIEGSERDVFDHIEEEVLNKISALAIEIHEHLNPGTYTLILNKLKEFNHHDALGEYNFFTKL